MAEKVQNFTLSPIKHLQSVSLGETFLTLKSLHEANCISKGPTDDNIGRN